jgi:GGDEF domain-containing protein
VTVSIGVSSTTDGRITSAALLSQADRNLYAAKRSGATGSSPTRPEAAVPHPRRPVLTQPAS